MSQNPQPLIHINGYPGTGKLTIARALEQKLAPGARLIHNHLLINPADAVLHRTEPGYQDLRKAIRGTVFAALAEHPSTRDSVYIFTDFQSSDAVGSATCAEYLEAARARGCLLVSVVLTCDEGVNLERLVSAERRAHCKIVDPELLRSFRAESTIHRFEASDSVVALDVDVSRKTPEQAAEEILDHVLRMQKQTPTHDT
ncbi:hypothetical protein BDP81DRAFT_351658 [Colletotrichum phormii]|uniref:Uncharacterized protein n=1 Tax=Colletotrichum phormii TaxID=359342 RepID=A0AAI9ZNE5_9PEZI|nr:uncharacterized protein BDP81DRAFT_351658 [Colletotrichum phormii]KAK1635158.1 hypothetical protein BDP81DRAFT_351658 [Colletotrichum phormii]